MWTLYYLNWVPWIHFVEVGGGLENLNFYVLQGKVFSRVFMQLGKTSLNF
jgi:hypothetical protein